MGGVEEPSPAVQTKSRSRSEVKMHQEVYISSENDPLKINVCVVSSNNLVVVVRVFSSSFSILITE